MYKNISSTMTHEERTKEREIHIFKKFANIYPKQIIKDTIENRKSPEPDILCEIYSEGKIAFELVELIENISSQKLQDSLNLKRKLQDYCASTLLDGERNEFQKKYYNVLLYINFQDNITSRKKCNAFRYIFSHLQNLPEGYSGKTYQKCHSAVKYISIRRGEFAGPIFNVDASSGFLFNVIEKMVRSRIKDKIENPLKYKTEHPMELLAYIDMQLIFDGRIIINSIDGLKEELLRSNFQHLWIFHIHENKILYNIPLKM